MLHERPNQFARTLRPIGRCLRHWHPDTPHGPASVRLIASRSDRLSTTLVHEAGAPLRTTITILKKLLPAKRWSPVYLRIGAYFTRLNESISVLEYVRGCQNTSLDRRMPSSYSGNALGLTCPRCALQRKDVVDIMPSRCIPESPDVASP